MQSASPIASAAVVLAVGHEVQRAGFLGDLAVERDVRRLRQRRGGVARDRDDPRADAPDRFEKPEHLLRLAAVRDGEQHVARLNDAEIAVGRFGRVEEERRRAGAGQRRGHLAADDAGFAHARDDDPPLAFVEDPHRPVECLVEPVDERGDRRRLGLQHAPRQ